MPIASRSSAPFPWPCSASPRPCPVSGQAPAARSGHLDDARGGPFDALHFRDIGPAATGGRIHDLQIDPKNPAVLYVGAATGGIWKSTNKGVTWKDVFGTQPDNTFGALAIFERRLRRSSGPARASRTIARARRGAAACTARPTAARRGRYLGLHDTRVDRPRRARSRRIRTWRTSRRSATCGRGNPERGVFKTTDAGRTWTKVLYVDPFTGATDLVMDPRDSKVLYAATYQRLRKAFGFNGGGPGSAIYKTTDAGATWKKLENGIPAGDKGRIGLALALSKPDVLDRDDRARHRPAAPIAPKTPARRGSG